MNHRLPVGARKLSQANRKGGETYDIGEANEEDMYDSFEILPDIHHKVQPPMFKIPSNTAILVDANEDKDHVPADKGRFILSKATQLEFGLQEADIPDNMKEVRPKNTQYTDFVSRNVRYPSVQNDVNKICYMSKIKTGIEQQADARTRMEKA